MTSKAHVEELAAAYERRARRLRDEGPLGELIYEPLLDARSILSESLRYGPIRTSWQPRKIYCEVEEKAQEHRVVQLGSEQGVVYCTSCGWGFYDGRHYDRAIGPTHD